MNPPMFLLMTLAMPPHYPLSTVCSACTPYATGRGFGCRWQWLRGRLKRDPFRSLQLPDVAAAQLQYGTPETPTFIPASPDHRLTHWIPRMRQREEQDTGYKDQIQAEPLRSRWLGYQQQVICVSLCVCVSFS